MKKQRALSLSLIVIGLTLLGVWASATWLTTPSRAAQPPTQQTSGVFPLSETFEDGQINGSQFTSDAATCQPGGCGWTVTNSAHHNGSYAAHAPDVTGVSDQRLVLVRPIALPAAATSASLTFYQSYNFEGGGGNYYDGGVLELSTDGGNWFDASAHITSGGYTGIINSTSSNPLGGRHAWIGSTNGQWVSVQVDLHSYAGHSVAVRFRLGTDQNGGQAGWWVDDINLSYQAPVPCGTANWGNAPHYPYAITGAATVSLAEKLYVFGGVSGPGNVVAIARKYDPATSTWTTIADLPTPRYGASAVTDGSYIYILGGETTNFALTPSFYRYNPAANTYTTLATPLTPTVFQAAVWMNGTIYRIGGASAGGATQTMDRYIMAGNTWGVGLSLPHAVYGEAAAVLNGHIFVAGGDYGNGVVTDLAYRYEPLTASWESIPSLPGPVGDLSSAFYNGRWIVLGGSVHQETSSGVFAFDPATYEWASLSQLLLPTSEAGVGVAGFKLITVGGTINGTGQNFVQVYSEDVCPTAPPSPTKTPHTAMTATPTVTAAPCSLSFSDVPSTAYFYTSVQYLACHGIVSGYGDGTFRPYNNTTRAQMVKIVVLGLGVAGYTPPGSAYTFADVPRTAPFWSVIEAAAHAGVVSGYACGGAGESCDSQHRPYFRPNANVTRGQLAKITVNAMGWILAGPASPSFTDVPATNPFYSFVETAYCHGIVSGYACGGAGEPCDAQHHPYFRPGANATRGQIAKIVYGTISGGTVCVLPQ